MGVNSIISALLILISMKISSSLGLGLKISSGLGLGLKPLSMSSSKRGLVLFMRPFRSVSLSRSSQGSSKRFFLRHAGRSFTSSEFPFVSPHAPILEDRVEDNLVNDVQNDIKDKDVKVEDTLVDDILDDVRYKNVREDLKDFNGTWEFGSINHKSIPSEREKEKYELEKLKNIDSLSTDVLWVDSLSDEELDRGIAELSKWCSSERLKRFDVVLDGRTNNIRMVLLL
jgi:hypothetical protein